MLHACIYSQEQTSLLGMLLRTLHVGEANLSGIQLQHDINKRSLTIST